MTAPQATWPNIDILPEQSYLVNDDVYFCSQFLGSPTVAPTVGAQDQTDWTIYLTMASSGPYNLSFTAVEVSGSFATMGVVAPGMLTLS